jgi:RNA polymerase sigma factor (sigma-70 family)
MDDRDAVAAIVAGDPAGLADIYDRYASSLYSYCRTMLREPADAADATQDTFVIAAAKVEGLRDPRRLRPWLYAVARNECHRRLRGREAPGEVEDTPDETIAEPGSGAEKAELRELVRAAVSGLNPPDREVIELNLRHDLEGADLAAALGVSRSHAHAMASRARGQLEKSLGALLVARTGRRGCPTLDVMLADWDGRLTVLLRKRVSRHIEECERCGERKQRALQPALLYGIAPLAIVPAELRERVLRLVSDDSPEAQAVRAETVKHVRSFGQNGFPRPLRWGLRGGRDAGAALIAAGSVAAAAAVVIAVIALRGGGTPVLDAKTSSGAPAATSAPATSSASLAPSPSPEAPPSPSVHSSAVGFIPPPAGPSPSRSPSSKTSKSATPSKSSSASPSSSPAPSSSPPTIHWSPSASPSTSNPAPN